MEIFITPKQIYKPADLTPFDNEQGNVVPDYKQFSDSLEYWLNSLNYFHLTTNTKYTKFSFVNEFGPKQRI